MTTLIDDAVRVLRELPEDIQAAAARAILDYGAGFEEDFHLSDKQAIEVARRMTTADRTFLSLDETRDHLRPFGI